MRYFLIILILILVVLTGIIFSFLPLQKEGLFWVKEGEGLRQISQNLKEEGFVRSKLPFYFYVLWQEKAGELKPGAYLVEKGDSPFSLADRIIAGRSYRIKITIPEGFNLKQIEKELAQFPFEPDLGAFLAGDFQEEFDFLKEAPGQATLEGFLFPDTYFFELGTDEEKIVKAFLKNFDKKLTSDLKEEIERQGKTIFEIMTMASMIEKEVRTLEDKKLVSGILWKRLEAGMPLQVDATITYITGKKTVRIPLEDLQIDSPYNTYKYRGLPAGPICNPGLDSIIAALYPESSNYWYYLSTPEGETIFSKTLEEHNIAKTKYLR